MRFAGILTAIGIALFSNLIFPSTDKPLLGFTDKQASDQMALESKFDSHLKAENLKTWMQRLTAKPNHTGSAYAKENAEFVAGLFQSWGYKTQIETFHVLFPTPKTRILEMIEPEKYTAVLTEPKLDEDQTSGQQSEQLPTYNAFSTDGDVTGELVYVNYGVPKDYEELELRGIDVRGKIVIARYGGSWRGVKPKVAAEHGAVGCIIYSDPGEDGYYQGDVYPTGGWRNDSSVQRGSVLDFTEHGGDPLTPFIPATKDAKRISRNQSNSITKIPVLPISYKDALPLLRSLKGPIVPEAWRGALPIAYHFGPGPARVHLKLEFNWDIVPIYDVIARMEGAQLPDQWIIRGNHIDGWVNGATDPISGLVALMEEARAIGELSKTGWRPKRTLIFCAWGAEEQGLLGSIEWVESHRDELRKKAVAYINSDSNSRGFFSAQGSQTLEKFINQIARDVEDPIKKVSVWERLRAYIIMIGSPEDRKEIRSREDIRLPAVGSGSDYTPFVQHAGIASLNISYGDEEEYGQYHSIYDSFDHYTKFMDPTFEYGVTLAKTGGRCMLRLANAEILPFEFTGIADSISKYTEDLKELLNTMRNEIDEKNRRIRDKSYEMYFDSRKKFVIPSTQDPVPYLNFAPLENATATLERSAQKYKEAYEKFISSEQPLEPANIQKANGVLLQTERALTRKEGLPGRPWWRHQIYAPGVYTGYAARPLPSISEAITQKKWKLADEQIVVVAKTLENFAAEIDRATQALSSKR